MIREHLRREFLRAIGLEALKNPNPRPPDTALFAAASAALRDPSQVERLLERSLAGVERFYRELVVYPRPGLCELTGLWPTSRAWWRKALADTPVVLPKGVDLRATRHQVSQIDLQHDYRAALAAARKARRERRGAPVRAAWAAAFPAVPVADWQHCATPADAAVVALKHQDPRLGPLSDKTILRLVHSTPAWSRERWVADLDDVLKLLHLSFPPPRSRD